VSKTDERLEAYADCEEANAALGLAITLGDLDERVAKVLRIVQNDLFDAGADLASPLQDDPEYPPLRIEQEYIDRLEAWIDEFNEELQPLDSFILPGGSPAGAYLHVARTVTRRAERAAWAAVAAHPKTTSVLPARYLNRLSDLLFVVGRVANPEGDIKWVPGGER
jgi:cob(I)alamin adenosyltransferase